MSDRPVPAGSSVREGDLLYVPDDDRVAASQLSVFSRWLADERQRTSTDYDALWRWSVEDLPGFWQAVADWCEVPFRTPASETLRADATPDGAVSAEGARFFVGGELNYVDSILRHDPARTAVVAVDETGGRSELTYGELISLAAGAAAGLQELGVERGDRVAAVLTNGIPAIATLLAAASLGAIFSSCAPEFGAPSMIDRFQQIDPKVLVTTSSYRYGGKDFEMGGKMATVAGSLAGVHETSFADLVARGRGEVALSPRSVEFSHPLWILYSSGTTGLPKAIVHGHGGIVLEHLKALRLQSDIATGDRFFWFSTTGWMMWNYLLGGLLVGATIVCYDGSPVYPDTMALWRLAARERLNYFGTSAPFLESCRRAGLSPRQSLDLSSVRSIGSTGAPLSPEGFAWASRQVGDDVAVASVSGGTDVCTGFLSSSPWLPVHAGELQCAALGALAEAVDSSGRAVVGEVGELVVRTPMPSMPLFFWGDEDGSRLHDAYFANFPGAWRHGDWVKRTERGTFVVYGRSDATLNRGGVRMGTAEFYRVVEAVPGVRDSLVVDTSQLGREGELILFLVLEPWSSLDEAESTIRRRVREQLSPRHAPDRVLSVSTLPRTLSGKKVEVPVRRILLGAAPDEAVSRDSLVDPGSLDAVLCALEEGA